jgi:hypothetical protein
MDGKRLASGFGWGLVATLAMSILMVIAFATGVSPMPKPIPAAIVGKVVGGVLGEGIPQRAIVALAVATHFAYGGFWGAVLAALTRPVTLWKGLGLGVFLWLLMDMVALPFLGWGFFGVGITPQIVVATLVLHLVYGATLGLVVDGGQKGNRAALWAGEKSKPS